MDSVLCTLLPGPGEYAAWQSRGHRAKVVLLLLPTLPSFVHTLWPDGHVWAIVVVCRGVRAVYSA